MMFSSSTCRLVLLVSAAFNAMTSVEATNAVDLGFAEDYVILAKTGISTVPKSAIKGDIAVSPIVATAMTGFSLSADSSNTFATSTQLEGKAYAPDYFPPIPALLTTAVSNMEAAYTDAAGRTNPDAARQNIGGGVLGVETGLPGFEVIHGGKEDPTTSDIPLTPGIYTFGSDVDINGDIYFDATDDNGNDNADAVFIIQISGNLRQVAGIKVHLVGGALAKNVFWQVAKDVTVGAGAHMQGIILTMTKVLFETGSSLDGRVLTQTRCDLQVATITAPASRRRFLRSS
jgi:hypothetical protein